MKILVTADFQADYQNLDLCTRAWDEILEICGRETITYVVVAGDLKQVYNPVDARVIRWWFDAIRTAKQNAVGVLCNLGNHDRLGLYVNTENWFPILRKTGAQCFDKPAVLSIDGLDIAFLPYRNNNKLLRGMAEELASRVSDNSILIFHGEVCGAKYNQFGTKADSGLDSDILHASRYRYCIGGHFHMQQKIGENIYYCGSPFAQDWGEANQEKGYLVTDGHSINSIRSSIPGWYDPTWPNFKAPESWVGTKVRLHLECRSTVDYLSEVSRLRDSGEKRYGGAEIFISTTFCRKGETEKAQPKLSTSDPDQIKIREYVRQTCPENISPSKVESYLSKRLEQHTGRWERTGTRVEFLKATASNFLSFKALDVDWSQKGIVVVQGTNNDRKNKSNGSGKTSLLQTIPVALFGSTFKGQKHDRWATRGCDEKSSVSLELRDGKNRRIKIVRSRKPAELRLWVDGKEQSTGMNPQDKEGTQGLVEKLTGLTWKTLSNAVYIDQEVAYQFIAGTKKSRTEVLSKIQNLERFTKALEVVRKDRAKAEEWSRQVEESIAVIQEKINGCNSRLTLLLDESESFIADALKELERAKATQESEYTRLKPLEAGLMGARDRAEQKYEACREQASKDEMALGVWKAKREMLERQRPHIDALSGQCPTCRQHVTEKYIASVNKKLDSDLKKLVESISLAKRIYQESLKEMYEAEGKYDRISSKVNEVSDKCDSLQLAVEEAERNYREVKRRAHNESDSKRQVQQELKDVKRQLISLEKHQVMHSKELEFYDYCEKALSRDGIPAFLNALLCEPLNVAAEYYSELFADSALQVRFALEEGEFVPVVVNATGGESIEDQSDGERALAGLIASFALRETTPHCNLLILDEPGSGLDPSAARQFAKGLRTLLSKFSGIWLTTHNSAIASELVDQQTINVVKQRGVSSVLNFN